MKLYNFLDMQRATSAGSIGTSFKHPNRTTQRPSTAALTS